MLKSVNIFIFVLSTTVATTVATSVLTTIASTNAFALPTLKDRSAPPAIPGSFDSQYNFEGIVALDDCSGSLIRFAQSLDSDAALVLTNGHCLESGMPGPGEVVTNQDSSREMDLMAPDGSFNGKLYATQVLYSTMTGTDITLYRLNETYADILGAYGVHAFELAPTHPQAGTSIEVISGYWQRGYSCAIDGFVNELREGDWTWMDSIRYTEPGCEVIGGTSGSPIVQAGTRTVIGINNTTNESGAQCSVDNPCEVDASGNVTYKKGLSYGEETYQISTCVNASRDIDLSLPGCRLAQSAAR